jgi:hypothetical protein
MLILILYYYSYHGIYIIIIVILNVNNTFIYSIFSGFMGVKSSVSFEIIEISREFYKISKNLLKNNSNKFYLIK